MFRFDSDAGILHRDEYLIGPVLARSDAKFAMAVCHRTHGLDAVHQKIHYNLLQLDAVAIDRWKRRPELEPQRYTMNVDFPADQRDDVVDDLIYIEPHAFERALFDRANLIAHRCFKSLQTRTFNYIHFRYPAGTHRVDCQLCPLTKRKTSASSEYFRV